MKSKVAFSFNSIYVIESLLDNDTKTGTRLYEDLIKWRTLQHNLYSELFIVGSADEFRNTFAKITKNLLKEGKKPYIHFEIHGSKEGFVLSNGDFISWEELYELCISLNTILKNQLFISLATCYGAYVYNILIPTLRAPFYGYIGPTSIAIVDHIEKDFYTYFDILLTELDFDKAMTALNQTEADKPYFLCTGGMIFDMMKPHLLRVLRDKRLRREKFKELFAKTSQPGFVRNYNRHDIRKNLRKGIANRENNLKIRKAYFLMEDL